MKLVGKRKADLLVYGNCSNAGDVLIYQTFKKLFEKELATIHQHIRQDKLNCKSRNVILGPGGILSGSYKPDTTPDELVVKHLTVSKIQSWKESGKNLFCFGSGTNTPFNANKHSKPFSRNSEKIIAELASATKKIYLRGSRDILRLAAFCHSDDVHKFAFQPCPSVFLDRLFDIKPSYEDKIAVNFPLAQTVTENNYKNHPLIRFKEYANSLGLKVYFLDNHPMDTNKYVIDMFDGTTHDENGLNIITSDEFSTDQKYNKLFHDIWENFSNLPGRYNGYRFAFGARLHSFLPFMAYNTPTLFLSANDIRQPMPIEYFNHPVFGAPVCWTGSVNLDRLVDGMIERLDYFIKHEDKLRKHIHEERDRLWQITKKNKKEMLSGIK